MPLAICFRGHTCSPGRKTARWHHWNLFAIEGKLKGLSHLQHISVYLIWLGGTSVFISFTHSTFWNMNVVSKILKLLEHLPYNSIYMFISYWPDTKPYKTTVETWVSDALLGWSRSHPGGGSSSSSGCDCQWAHPKQAAARMRELTQKRNKSLLTRLRNAYTEILYIQN